MLNVEKTLPKDPDELRQFTALLLAEVKSQAVLIEKLRHQLAGQRHHRFGSSSESIEQLQLALETSEIAVAKMTAKLRLPDEEPKDKPKRRPIPDHIPRMEIELTTGDDDCAQCGGGLRRLGEDVTEELEYVPGRFIVNRIVRPRFACSGCEAFTQAALPSRPIERGRPVKCVCPTSRSILLSVVGTPPQDADCGRWDAPNLYLGLEAPAANPSQAPTSRERGNRLGSSTALRKLSATTTPTPGVVIKSRVTGSDFASAES